MSSTKPPPPARGRQAASKPLAAVNVTSSTASTRAKVSVSTKAELRTSKSTSGTLKADARQLNTRPVKVPVHKASERINRSTSTRSVVVPSSTEGTSALKAPTPAPAPKESTYTPTESTVNTESTNPPKEATNLSESTTSTKPSSAPPPKPQNGDKPKLTAPVPTSDPLQVAAQLYPWLYMTSTLDACFQSAEQTAKKDLETRAQHLTESESELADQKIRFQAERAAEFYDALSTDAFAQTAPRIMQAFLAHGDVCERVEAEALQLALNPAKTSPSAEGDEEDGDWDAPLRVYAKMLDTLEQLHAEALELEASIVKLTSSLEPRSEIEPEDSGAVNGDMVHDKPAEPSADAESGAQAQILGVFKACLPVLRARIANLEMAQELVDGARENTSISLRMESLGLLD